MQRTRKGSVMVPHVILAVVMVLLGSGTAFARAEQQPEYKPDSNAAAYRAAVEHRQTQEALRNEAHATGDWTAYDRFMWPGLITTSTPVAVSEETIRWKQSLVDDNNKGGADVKTKVITSKTFDGQTFYADGQKIVSPAINAYEYKMQYMQDHPQQTISKDVAFVGQMSGYSNGDIKNNYK